ncbi:hypothetical protein HY008_01710 [Candidatus Woesebacteria bacterium]|nr:hypothetical protein [Candidatus Woesebacteria bacterium]
MKKLNLYLTLLSINVLLVTVERFSFTTKIILQPYSFLRLHEIFQMSVIILFTVIIPFFVLKDVTNNFAALKTTRGTLLGLLFLVGIYFYATGNGLHEVASHLFNTFCDTKSITNTLCGSMFFNDYYVGNILYFIGAFMFTVAIIVFERGNPNKNFTKKDMLITLGNGVVYAFAIFAYAAFDRVLVGLVYSLVTAFTSIYLLVSAREKFIRLPYTTYSAFAFTLASVASLLVRLR